MGSVTSITDGRRHTPVHDLCSSLSCITLPVVHALTGCDNNSAIFGIGNKYVFKLIKSSSAELSDLSQVKNLDLNPQYVLQERLWHSCMIQKQSISPATPI